MFKAVLLKPDRLVAAAMVLGLLMLAAAPVRGQVNVSVDVNDILTVMPAEAIGIHTSQYYNQVGNSNLDNRLEEAGVTTLRIGGGGYADVYHWSITRAAWDSGITEDAPGAPDCCGGGLSPWFGDPNDFGYVGGGSDLAGFVGLLDQVQNGRAVATVNYGSALKLEQDLSNPAGVASVIPDYGGQPKEAAAWVAYANADPSIYGTGNDIVIGVDQQGNDWKTAGYWARLRASTQSEYNSWATTDGVYEPLNAFLAINRDNPIGIEYWEIGNETFGTGYYDGGNGYSVDYDVPYDGTNRFGHPDLSPEHYGEEIVEYSQLMKSIDPTIKIGAVLNTPPDDYNWGPDWNDDVLDEAAGDIDFVMVHWYPFAGMNADGDSLLADVRTDLPQMINGSTSGQDFGNNAGLRDSLAAHGIPNAEIMVTEFNYNGSLQGSVENSVEALFVADSYATWLDLGVTSVQYLEMLTKDFLSDSGSLSRGSAFYGIQMLDFMAEPGEELVDTSSSSNNIRVHAAVQDDGSVAVMVLNTGTSTTSVDISINGDSLDTDGTRYSTSGTGITTTALSGLGNNFSISIPGRTIYTYVIPAGAGGSPDKVWAAAVSGDFGAASNWINGVPGSPGDTATFNVAGTYTVTFDNSPNPLSNPVVHDTLFFSAGNVTFRSQGPNYTYNLTDDANITGGTLNLGVSSDAVHMTVGDDLVVNGGATLNVNFGSDVDTTDLFLGQSGDGTINVDGNGSSLDVSNSTSLGLGGNTATLTYRNAASGSLLATSGTVGVGASNNNATVGILNVESNADVNVGNLNVAPNTSNATGTVNVQGSGSTLTQSGGSTLTVGSSSGGAGVVNVGTTSGGGTLTTGSGTTTINNTGTVNVGDGNNNGTFNVNGDLNINGGTFTRSSGSGFNLDPGSSMTIQNGGQADFAGSYTTAANADYTVTGTGSQWSLTGNLNLGTAGAASLTVTSNGALNANALVIGADGELHGDGDVNADVTSSGMISPGESPGVMTIDGDFFQNASGGLLMELASSSSYDELIVTGTMDLDGTLDVVLFDGYNPADGHSFDLFDAAGINNTFDTINLPTLDEGLEWDTSQLYTTGTLSVMPAVMVPGDADGDGDVDLDDYDIMSGNMYSATGNGASDGDFNDDGFVNFDDFIIQALNFGDWPDAEETLDAVPEPAMGALIGAAVCLFVARRGSKT